MLTPPLDKADKSPAGVPVLVVALQVIVHLLNTGCQKRDLNSGGSGIGIMNTGGPYLGLFFLFCKHKGSISA